MINHRLSKIFKAYDIRGLTPTELSPEVAQSIGRAFADFMPKGKIAVGRDMRTDSKELAHGFIAGLLMQGREVLDLGLITSDMIYFAVGKHKLAGGAMITASHNPGQYDGIKLTGKGVVPIGIESGLLALEEKVEKEEYKKMSLRGSANNTVEKKDIVKDWFNHAQQIAGNIERPLKIGIDTGNGMAAIIIPYLKKAKNLDVDNIYIEIDGSFPNHSPNPLDKNNTKDLQEMVKEKGLDCGIAFDGDGDRAFFIDEKGDRISASIVGTILAERILKKHPKSKILYSAIVSHILPETVIKLGGEAIRTRVGHSFIKQKMHENKAHFAAEHSGHYYFAENYNADSGLIAALSLLHILSSSNNTLSSIVAKYKKYFNSEELNFDINQISEDTILKKLENHYSTGKIDHLDGLTIYFDDWWFNARPSNTEPYIRVNIETNTQELLNQKIDEIQKLFHQNTNLKI